MADEFAKGIRRKKQAIANTGLSRRNADIVDTKPEPMVRYTGDDNELVRVLDAMRRNIEALSGARGNSRDSAVTFRALEEEFAKYTQLVNAGDQGSTSSGGTSSAGATSTVTASFNGVLSAADDTVQKALDTIDDINLGGGGLASDITLVTTSFTSNLSAADTDVQLAMDTIDDLILNTSDATTLGNKPLWSAGNNWNIVPYVTATGEINIGNEIWFHSESDASVDTLDFGIKHNDVTGNLEFLNDAGSSVVQITDAGEIQADGGIDTSSGDLALRANGVTNLTLEAGGDAVFNGTVSATNFFVSSGFRMDFNDASVEPVNNATYIRENSTTDEMEFVVRGAIGSAAEMILNSSGDLELSGGLTTTGAVTATLASQFLSDLDVTGIGTFLNTVQLSTTQRLYFDGGVDTYLQEDTANNLRVVAGGTERLNVNSSGIQVVGDITATVDITATGNITATGAGSFTLASQFLSDLDVTGIGTFLNTVQLSTTQRLYFDGGVDTYMQEDAANNLRAVVGGTERLNINSTGVQVAGTITATGGSSTDWNTAFGWGDHTGLYLTDSAAATISALWVFQLDTDFNSDVTILGALDVSLAAGFSGVTTFTDSVHFNGSDSIFFESGKHAITWNDGQGNFNIRVGHVSTSGGIEESTEDGYAQHMEWMQSTGELQFNFSTTTLLVGGVVTWRKTLSLLPSGDVAIDGDLTLGGTVDGRDVATDGTKLDGIDSGAEANVATNITWTPGTTAGPVCASSTGTDAAIPVASASASGAVNTIAQTFAGIKTFNAELQADGGIDTSSGDLAFRAAGVSALTLDTGGDAVFNGTVNATGFFVSSGFRMDFNDAAAEPVNNATYIRENSSTNEMEFVVRGAIGSAAEMILDSSGSLELSGGITTTGSGTFTTSSQFLSDLDVTGIGTFLNTVQLSTTQRLYFDGGSNTYMQENSADNLRAVVGGSERFNINSTGIQVVGTITATGGSSTDWNTAFGWGDHAGLYLTDSSAATISSLWTFQLDTDFNSDVTVLGSLNVTLDSTFIGTVTINGGRKRGKKTISAAAPSGGADGDEWYRY